MFDENPAQDFRYLWLYLFNLIRLSFTTEHSIPYKNKKTVPKSPRYFEGGGRNGLSLTKATVYQAYGLQCRMQLLHLRPSSSPCQNLS